MQFGVASAYFTVLGTLLGVGITVTAQFFFGIIQRNHDRSTKLFEFKTELYADILLHLERLHQRLSTVNEMITNVKAENRGYFEQINDFYETVGMAKTLGEEFGGKLAETLSTSDRERIKSAQNRYKSLVVPTQPPGLEQSVNAIAAQHELVQASYERFLELQTTAMLVAGKEVLECLADVLKKAVDERQLSRDDFKDFYKAARREVGIKAR